MMAVGYFNRIRVGLVPPGHNVVAVTIDERHANLARRIPEIQAPAILTEATQKVAVISASVVKAASP
jgi:hypothetical protein